MKKPAPSGGFEIGRREFLLALGAGAAISLPAAVFRRPEEKIVPHLIQPEETVPGVASWYASTCAACPAACGTLVKTREGRPIKVEGNPLHPLSRGGLCPRGQASVLDLYNATRPKGPWFRGANTSWEVVDEKIVKWLGDIDAKKGEIRILTESLSSPTLLAAIEEFRRKHPSTKHVVHDALGASAILDAHRLTHGARALPRYRFEKAKVIVGVDADFLGTWISPVEFTRGWVASAHGIYRGGLGVHLAMVALGGHLGMQVDLDRVPASGITRDAALLFSESAGRFIVTIDPVKRQDFEKLFEPTTCACIGTVTALPQFEIRGLDRTPLVSVEVSTLKAAWKKPFGDLI